MKSVSKMPTGSTPNIEKNYQAYHRRGFDVVSVSVDRDRRALDQFLAEHKHPWIVLHDNYEARGTDKSLSTYYGIFGIPKVFLVGADGKVEQRMIEVDRAIGDRWLVASGLAPGERVIVEGIQKVRPGTAVKVVPFQEGETNGAAPKKTAQPAPKSN